MGTAERKKREKQQRKNEIIDAAENKFFKKGMKTQRWMMLLKL